MSATAPAVTPRLALSIFAPFAAAYLLSQAFRVINAVLAPDLAREFGIDAQALGFLTSAYFLAFAAFQLPLGILLDRFGPRRTEAGLLVFAAAGAVVFALAQSLTGLVVGRVLIGLGVSACLMGAFKAFRVWFPGERLAFINGCQMAIGGFGVLAATRPLEMALGITDWRTLFLLIGALTAAAALAIFIVVPERTATPRKDESLGEQMRGMLLVFTSRPFWRIAPLVVTTYSTYFAIQGLWAGPWLRDVARLDRNGVADHLFVFAVATVAGYFLVGTAAEQLTRRGWKLSTVMLCGAGLFMVFQVPLAFQWALPQVPVWIALGTVASVGILAYADLPQRFPAELSGRVITGLNVLVFVVAFVIQWGMGAIINLWPTTAAGGYDPQAYHVAFVAALALQAGALIWFFLLHERPSA